MRVTIIRDDGVAGIDGLFRQVDLSALSPEFMRYSGMGQAGISSTTMRQTPL